MIVVYGAPGCSQCKTTQSFLTSRDVDFTYVDVREKPEVAEELKAAGRMSLPVVVVKDNDGVEREWWTGFRPDKLMRIASA